MLDSRYVSEHLDEVRGALAKKGFEDVALFERLERLLSERRDAIGKTEALQHERNAASKAMASFKDKSSPEFAAQRQALKSLSDEVKALEHSSKELQAETRDVLLSIPNLPAESAPVGKSEEENVELRRWGSKPDVPSAKDHVELGEALGILDFERATKISGSRFAVLKGLGARLERGLIQFMLDLHVDTNGYEEVWVPTLVKDSAMLGTTQLPKFAGDSFRIYKDHGWAEEAGAHEHDLYLCPTGEVPITNLHADEILDGDTLPVAYCGYTSCFRSEAGSYGRDTRGLIRQHQFDKIELVRFVTADDAEAQHVALTSHAESVLKKLGLHYRVVDLCTGDMSFGAKRCFDIEVWLPGQDAFREISSCSWFGDFQARRMNARYRPAPKAKPQMLHTINGSGLAVGRTLVAILEQYQQPDGSVVIPEALRPYVGGNDVISV